MDITNSVIGFVKDFGPTIWKYVKYQIYHNDYVSEFQQMQEKLRHRQNDVDANLKTQLEQPGKITSKEVEAWLEEAGQETAEKVVEDLICKGGCFTNICSSRRLDKKTQALNEGIFKEGEKYTNAGESLVIDDHSIPYCVSVFADKQKQLKHQKEFIEANLKTQLMQPGKIARKEVENWLEKASQQISMKVEDLISQEECSSSTNLEEKIEELKRMLEEGKEFANIGVSLVVNDHSFLYCVSVFEDKQKQLKHQKEFIEANLKTQLMQPGKIARKEVENWLEKASQQIVMKVEDLISQEECSSSTNLEEKIEELKRVLEEGKEFANIGVSLVVDDHSIPYCVSVFADKQKQLKHQKEFIEANLKTQLMQPGKIARKEVENWLEKASQQIFMKVEDLISQEECSSSTNLEEKTEELKQIIEKGKEFSNDSVSLVVVDHSKKGVMLLVEKCIARDDIQEEILELLRGDKVTRIAVCGMGGVGKTTIMKQVHNQLLKEPKFNKVIWVKVSKDFEIVDQQKKQFDVLQFQKSIARKLGLELKNGEQDATELAGLMSETLQQSRCVLILDDVWEPFSLEDVGIPDLVGNNGCKLVLTTRLPQKVARAMECEVIHVKPLPDDEALALFLDKVGSDVLSYPRFKSDIEPFLNQILKKCNGLPLAIGVVAKTMRGKFDGYLWEMADKELSKSEEIVDRLKFSYDHLDEKCKNCFLYCALFPEDREIRKEPLIENLIGEEFIKDGSGSRYLMNCDGHAILEKLIDNSMLELVKDGDEEDCVCMHDLLREMALNISPQFMVKAGMALEELPEEHEWREDLLKVSLVCNNIREIPPSMQSPKCPMLTTLLLSNSNISTIPEAFFDHMLGLKVLDLSYNYKLYRLPSSISKLENLTTLLLENCESLREVPSLSNLGGLKKLNLLWTSIEELPQGFNMLTNMKFLLLGGEFSEIPDGLLQNLSKLQCLVVFEGIPLKGEEIGKLRKLEFLFCRFSTVHDMSLFVNSERKFLKEYYLLVESREAEEQLGSDITAEKVFNFSSGDKCILCSQIDMCGKANWLPSDLQILVISGCKDVRSLNSISVFQYATDLRGCIIEKCDDVEFVVYSHELKPLQNLESLRLDNLKNLNAVFEEGGAVAKSAPLPAVTFSSLKKIEVVGCDKIKRLFPLGLLHYLQNLKVKRCKQMEKIIWSECGEEGEKAQGKLTLPNLERLVLKGLPALKSIYSCSSTVLICDSIKRIKITECREIECVFWCGFNPLPTLECLQLWDLKNLKSVFDEEALGLLAPPTSFFSLKKIDVRWCPKLKKVFSSGWLLGYFQSLETIEVEDCEQMEELISASTYGEKEALEEVTLRKIERLKLKNLPELKSICSSSNVLICDSIKSLEINRCRYLERIPLHLPSLDNGRPPSLKQIQVDTKEGWESLEWDQPNAKDVLLRYVNFTRHYMHRISGYSHCSFSKLP